MFGNNWHDGYAANSYQYKPKWERDVERSPDKRPSEGRGTKAVQVGDREERITDVEPRGASYVLAIEVRGLGAVVMRATSTATGELVFNGVSLFTREEIQFDGVARFERGPKDGRYEVAL